MAQGRTDAPGTESGPLSSEDATLLCATTREAQLQIGALCIFEGAPLRGPDGKLLVDELRCHVMSRLHRLSRFRQRIQPVPLDVSRPVWIDDADFDLDRHLRTAELPGPGGVAELRRFVAELLGRPLDPAHPMWELWLIDGLDDGDVAVLLRTHHVVADGLSLLRAATALLDLELDPPAGTPPPDWEPADQPGPVELAISGLVERTRCQMGLAAAAGRELLDPRRVLQLGRTVATTVLSPPRPAPRVALTGRVGQRRDFLWTQLPLDGLRTTAHAEGVTLNDLVLGAVAGALRQLPGTGVATERADDPPKVLVPVGDVGDGDAGNTFSFVVAALPVHLGEPLATLHAIHDEMQTRKESRQSIELQSLFSAVDLVPIALLRRVAPGLLARQPFVNLVVTNLPGSPVPLYLRGARLRQLQPIVTGVGNIACIIGVLSYCGQLGVGITVDPDVVTDADELLHAVVDASEELIAATRT